MSLVIDNLRARAHGSVSVADVTREVWEDFARMGEDRLVNGVRLVSAVLADPMGQTYELLDILAATHFALTEGPDFATSDALETLVYNIAHQLFD